MQLTFVPSQTLKPKTNYVLHLSPNLQGSDGTMVNFAAHAEAMGGQAVPPLIIPPVIAADGTA